VFKPIYQWGKKKLLSVFLKIREFPQIMTQITRLLIHPKATVSYVLMNKTSIIGVLTTIWIKWWYSFPELDVSSLYKRKIKIYETLSYCEPVVKILPN
jgi:hypothetical protein